MAAKEIGDQNDLNPLQLIAASLTIIMVTLGWGMWVASRPRHYLTVWTVSGHEYRVRLKRPTGHYTWESPNKEKIRILLDQNFARPGKTGMRFVANDRGQLLRYNHATEDWLRVDGKRLENALKDGRVQQVARAGQESALLALARMALVAIGIVGVILVIGFIVLWNGMGSA